MNNLTITIKYKYNNSLNWHIVNFLANEYFDLDPDEKAGWDCVPLHNDSLDYLDIDRVLVQYIETTIVDIEADVTQIFAETFWNKGRNRIIEITVNGTSYRRETIIEINLENNPSICELLRYTKEDNLSKISYHGLFTDNDDGSQTEKIIYKS